MICEVVGNRRALFSCCFFASALLLSVAVLALPGARAAAASAQTYIPTFWYTTPSGQVSGSPSFGSAPAHLDRPIVGIAATPDGKGYWLVAADGGVFSFGDAKFFGSMGGQRLNAPIVGIAATPDGKGYWLVAADGGVFSFGDAKFFGSMGGSKLNNLVVGLASTPNGDGYWLSAADGGVFAFGGATFYGSDAGGFPYSAGFIGPPMPSPDGKGYWLAQAAVDNSCASLGDVTASLSQCDDNPPYPPDGYTVTAVYVDAVTAYFTPSASSQNES